MRGTVRTGGVRVRLLEAPRALTPFVPLVPVVRHRPGTVVLGALRVVREHFIRLGDFEEPGGGGVGIARVFIGVENQRQFPVRLLQNPGPIGPVRVFARQAEDRVEVFGLERLARGGDRARQLRELSLDGGGGVGVTLGRAVEAVHLAAVGL